MSPAAAAESPRPPELPHQLATGELVALAHDAVHADVELADLALSDQHAKGVTLRCVKLERVGLSGSRLEHLRVCDGVLDGCDLANVQAASADLERVVVAGGRLTGIVLTQAKLRDVLIRGCRVDLASFGFSRLTRVTFEDCLLAQSDFLDAELRCVRFHGCDLTQADFRGARLERCELRRCDLSDLQGVEYLRGAAMEWPDIVGMAGVWAAAMGVEVLDGD